jgi:hypothetical protein
MDATSTPNGAGHGDDALYHVWQLPPAGHVATYHIESTAPDNVEGPYHYPTGQELPAGSKPLDDRAAAAEVASKVAAGADAEIVFLINGFNTPRAGSKGAAERARQAIAVDATLQARKNLIFINYRWPSEAIARPFRTSLRAASVAFWLICVACAVILAIGVADIVNAAPRLPDQPWLPRDAHFWAWVEFSLIAGFFAVLLLMSRRLPLPAWAAIALVASLWAVLCFAVGTALRSGSPPWWVIPALSGVWLFALLNAYMIPAGLFTLRYFVYFRDAYRAANYGVPDLLQFIRDLDERLVALYRAQNIAPGAMPRIGISVIGHSMGALVATSLIRILSDVFPARTPGRSGGGAPTAPNSQRASETIHHDTSIGNCLRLGRLLLVSPDLTAAALLTHRANILRAALSRCDEAYLFSNAGDGVLRTASTLANYFSFPTGRRAHGYRLGNAEVVSDTKQYGIVNPKNTLTVAEFLDHLRVGQQTLKTLHEAINTEITLASLSPKESFACFFTYFDCTAYRDHRAGDPGGKPVGLLAWGTRKAKLGLIDHTTLLVQYLIGGRRKIDIHGGYFHGAFSQQLIYRLAGLGFAGTRDSYGGTLTTLSTACAEKQIRVLLSPEHHLEQTPAIAATPSRATREAASATPIATANR